MLTGPPPKIHGTRDILRNSTPCFTHGDEGDNRGASRPVAQACGSTADEHTGFQLAANAGYCSLDRGRERHSQPRVPAVALPVGTKPSSWRAAVPIPTRRSS